jgi:preprotein translocase subunit SecF
VLRDVVAGLGIKDAEQPVVTTSGEKAILVQTEPLSSDEITEVKAAMASTVGIKADDISHDSIALELGQGRRSTGRSSAWSSS